VLSRNAWLDRLPQLVNECAAKWALTLGSAYSGAFYSYVRRAARADGTPVVLKLSFPDEQARAEAAALRAFAGRGCVKLLAEDSAAGALLLERAQPGDHLAKLTDDRQAMSIAASVARRLAREAPADGVFPSVAMWRSDFDRAESELASEAGLVFDQLVGSASQTFLLHGDLHHFNILAAGDEWIAIDPKGFVGERECEIGPLVLNPLRADLAEILHRRIDQLSDELGLDRERAYAWTFVRAVLAILWAIEDHESVPPVWVRCANALRPT